MARCINCGKFYTLSSEITHVYKGDLQFDIPSGTEHVSAFIDTYWPQRTYGVNYKSKEDHVCGEPSQYSSDDSRENSEDESHHDKIPDKSSGKESTVDEPLEGKKDENVEKPPE